MRTGHTLIAVRDSVVIFHVPSEWERFQTRIGRLTLSDVSDIIASNQTREAYGSREDTIILTLPGERRE